MKPERVYLVFAESEGGFGQRLALQLLQGEGLDAHSAPAPVVGQEAVVVVGGPKIQKKAEKILRSY